MISTAEDVAMTLNYFLGQRCATNGISVALILPRLFILVIFSGRTRTPTSHRSASLTVTPYLRAMPCRVSLSVTRCSMNFSPREAVTLAVLPYERILVRARLWDSSLSDSEPDLDRGKMGWPSRPPPSRIGRTGENSAIFSRINKKPDSLYLFNGPSVPVSHSTARIQAAWRLPSPGVYSIRRPGEEAA